VAAGLKVTACLVTRGDCDLGEIIDSLPYDEVVIWDNSQRDNLGIYGRYAAIAEAKYDTIYVQDDDLVVTCHQQLLDTYEPGRLLCNYPEPWDIPWVARGALFHRDLPKQAFDRYFTRFVKDRWFTHKGCDGVFSLLTPYRVVDFGSRDLPNGFDPGRVSTTPGWYEVHRPLIQERVACLL
jgi:hypothetical protein